MSKGPPDWAVGPWNDRSVEPGVEVRPNDDGTIDEICIDLPARATFHMEQMDDGQYWIGIHWKKGRKDYMQHIMLTRHGKFIYPTVYR